MKLDFKFVPSKIGNINIFNKSIYFMHIPKCGGTTIDHIFLKLSSISENFHFKRFKYFEGNKKSKLSLNQINYSKKYFISGHLDYDFCENLNNIFKCSIVRDPISRVNSHYKFMIYKLKTKPEKYNFKTFINDEISKNRDNLITRHFTGLLDENKKITDIDFEDAVKNINSFDIISTFENWDKFLSLLLSKFSLPSVLYSRFQEHKYNFLFQPKEEDINLIKEFYNYDFKLYSKINDLKNNFKINYNDEYDKKICVVSPYFKTEDRLYKEEELKNLFSIEK